MTQTNTSQNQPNTNGQSGAGTAPAKAQLDLRNKSSVLSDGLGELRGVAGDGAKIFVLAAVEGQKLLHKVWINVIKPYGPAIGAVAAVSAAGAAGVSTVGVGGTAAAVGYTLWGVTTAAFGVATVGALMRVAQWIRGGSKVVVGAIADRIDDLRAGITAIKHGVQVAAAENHNHRRAKSTDKLETKEAQAVNEVVGYLEKLQARQSDTEAKAVIGQVKDQADIILNRLKDRIPQVFDEAERDKVSLGETKRQVNSFISYLKDELKQNILAKYGNLPEDQDPQTFLDDSLSALANQVDEFKVHVKGKRAKLNLDEEGANEDVAADKEELTEAQDEASQGDGAGAQQEPVEERSKVDNQPEERQANQASPGADAKEEADPAQQSQPEQTPEQSVSKYSSIFGNRQVSEAVEAALDGLTEESSEHDKKKVVQVIQKDLLGADVNLNPGDTSPVAEVVKRASIPAGREIPHFDDLFLQLKHSFGDKCSLVDGKIVIAGANRRSITLENRHNQHGGKVTVSFGSKEQGGMWNDKVEEVVRAFLEQKKYPTLEPAQAHQHRIVAATKSSQQEAKELFQELKAELGEANFGHHGTMWKITVGKSVIYAKRQITADSRNWEILDENKTPIARDISIKDLKAEILIAKEAEAIVSKLGARVLKSLEQDEKSRKEFMLPDGLTITVRKVPAQWVASHPEDDGKFLVYVKRDNMLVRTGGGEGYRVAAKADVHAGIRAKVKEALREEN